MMALVTLHAVGLQPASGQVAPAGQRANTDWFTYWYLSAGVVRRRVHAGSEVEGTIRWNMNGDRIKGRFGTAELGILTITREELESAQQVFGMRFNVPKTPYYVHASRDDRRYKVVLRRASDRGNTPATEATADFIEHWRPRFIFVVGTAGGAFSDVETETGRDETRLGDVIVGDFVDYTEFRKFHNRESLERRVAHDHPSLLLRDSYADPLTTSDRWCQGLERPDRSGPPKVFVGSVASGEKILGDRTNPYQAELTEQYDKALAFETESFGVARAVFKSRSLLYYNPQFLTIRGISDFINAEKANAQRKAWTRFAATSALTFARSVAESLLGTLDSPPEKEVGEVQPS